MASLRWTSQDYRRLQRNLPLVGDDVEQGYGDAALGTDCHSYQAHFRRGIGQLPTAQPHGGSPARQ